MLVGWSFNAQTLKGVVPGFATMKANTALCFFFAGTSLLLIDARKSTRRLRLYVTLLSSTIILVGLATLSEYLFGSDLRIDELLFRDIRLGPALGRSSPGRMAPATATNFVLAGLALMLCNANRSPWLTQLLASLIAINSGLALAGYLYGAASLYNISQYSSVALHTAVGFLLVALSILFAQPDRGVMSLVTSDSIGGIVVRRLLPVFLVLPAVLGWFRLRGQHAGLYDTEFGLSLLIVVMTVTFSGLILWIGSAISGVDRKRRLAEENLQEASTTYRLLFEAHPHPMWVYDVETLLFIAVNDAAITHYGYSQEQFMSMTILDIRPAEDIPSVLETVRSLTVGMTSTVFRRHLREDGSLIEVEGTSRELLVGGRRARLVLAIDVTERKRLEEQLRQSQKMEAIGRLAGGIAHDFNNLLTVILGYCDLASNRPSIASDFRKELKEIRKAGERATVLVGQLLAFSRKQVLQPRVLDLNEVIIGTHKMLRRVIGEDILLSSITRPGLGHVLADAGQIEQIILNLSVNARDAMPNGGKITIETANVDLDDLYARTHPEVVPGRYVLLAVSDTGQGMDAETQSHIFEPFFTTKGIGKGTGLGLSTVYGIVRQSGGHIWLYSEPGKGATFKVYFPGVSEPVESNDEANVSVESLHGTETVLVAEDEAAVRELTSSVLKSYGYNVLIAASGAEALMAAQQAPDIALLITDMVMPQMSGTQLAAAIVNENSQIRVLYLSGYTENAIVHHGVLDEGVAFLSKPFTPTALARKIREVLD